MAWVVVVLAGLLEVAWAVGLKSSAGFTRFWPSVATVACLAGSVYLLSVSVRELPLGTAYAVWTGIGAIGSVILGMAIYGEPRSAVRLLCIGLIAAGMIGLKATSQTREVARHPVPNTHHPIADRDIASP